MGKAAVVTKDKKVAVVSKPLRPLQHGEALLKMLCCGVCHTDLHVALHETGDTTGLTLGHEGVGIVKELGPGVTSLKLGDRVSVAWFYEGCGSCEFCISGDETFCKEVKGTGFTTDGAMAEECIVKANYSVKVPEGLDSAKASSITCAGVTVYKGIKVSKVKPGQWIAVFGLGGLGNMAVQFAKNVYNAKVVALDINEGQLNFAKEMGADLVVNPKKPDFAKLIQEVTGGGVHACVVTATAIQAYNSAVDILRTKATLVAIGAPMGNIEIPIQQFLMKGITITGSVVGTRQDLAEAFQFALEGKVDPKVTPRRLEEINEIFEEMEQGKIRGRMVIDFTR